MPYGRESYGQGPYGAQSFDTTGPSLVSVTPADTTRNISLSATVSFVLTAPDGLDPWSLSLTLAGLPAIAAGAFLTGYSGSIIFDGPDCTVTVSTHPLFTQNSNITVAISVTDLANITGNFTPTFDTVAIVDLAETPTLSEATDLFQQGLADPAETLTLSEAQTQSVGVPIPEAETLTLSESETTLTGHQVPLSETLTASEAVALLQAGLVDLTETPTLSETLATAVGLSQAVSETLTLSDAAALQVAHQTPVSDTLTLSEAVAPLHGSLVGVSESHTISDAVLIGLHTDVAETLTATESVALLEQGLLNEAETLTQTDAVTIGLHADVADTLTASESVATGIIQNVVVGETLTLTEYGDFGQLLALNESLSLTETVTFEDQYGPVLHGSEFFTIIESLQVISLSFESLDGTTIQVGFPKEMCLDGIEDITNFTFDSLDGGYPITALSVTPTRDLLHTGTLGQVINPSPGTFQSRFFDTVTVAFTSDDIGRYLFISPPPGATSSYFDGETAYRIEDVSGSIATLDRPVPTTDPSNGLLHWRHETGATGVQIHTTKSQNGRLYDGAIHHLRTTKLVPLEGHQPFTAVAAKPQVTGVEFLPDNGTVLVSFDWPMRFDAALTDPAEYVFTGPSSVAVRSVTPLDDQTLAIFTAGFGVGSYTLTVNATGTPKDIAGNPLDPLFNQAIFTSSVPLTNRSIFVDRGPITKPPLSIATGVGIAINDPTLLTLTGGSLSPTVVGLYITLGANTTNGGVFPITAWLSPTQIKVKANLHLPDLAQGTTTWEVYDPRNGEIADDPADVSVRINSLPVTAESVIGLLGQIVLASPPAPADDVKVDYSFICNPTVEVRRLNSKEFRLNAWNRDQGYGKDVSAHHYRYNNVLITPSNFVAADMQATLAQPRQRDLKYRAYERAYSALLNDPNLLLLNSPTHHIAYPPLSRTVESSFVSYSPTVLPEVFPDTPWERKGSGSASITFDRLVVNDTSGGPFPVGDPIYWTRNIDLTFPHIYAATWQLQIDAVTTYEGVWTGIAAGFSDEYKAIVIGYLLVGGVRKIGILRRGYGNDPSTVDAWAGGLDSNGDPTGLPIDLDWSALHSFRIYQSGGVVRVYLDGEIIENLRLLEEDLPYLEELNDPFNQVQNVFFGSFSRPAVNQSTWDFVRYLILPTNPLQTAPSIFVSYEGNDLPETATPPWTPVGYHGTERIVSSSSLQVDSTSATDAATEALVGLIGGDFRGFARLEPLLAVSSDVVLDINVTPLTHTNGITPNACMAAIDDGTRLLQLSFFPDRASPKASYGGRSLPEDFQPTPWTPTGTAPVEMMGRTLRITDTSTTDGRVYFWDDVAGIGTDARIVASSTDYILEFRCTVRSYTPDLGGFSGVTGDIYDGSRTLGIMLLDIAGVRYVAPHSDGTLLPGPVLWPFEWADDAPHTYRLVKSGTDVTVLVDGDLLGLVPYASFTGVVGPTTGTISWGSSTSASMGARSVVDWMYANVWRLVANLRHYLGFWKGVDSDSLSGYHLPLKTSGRGAVVIGNKLTDSTASFVLAGVVVGDQLVIDVGGNKGTYEIASVTATELTILSPVTWPVQPSLVNYRIPLQVDWTVPHKYRMVRSPDGSTVLLLDSQTTALITIGYNEMDLPVSSVGVPTIISGGLPSITWGAFDPTNLSSTLWDFVRYGITRAPTEMRIAPHHQNLNQRNVMASPEHLRTSIPHPHTDFWSSNVGIPPQTVPDFLTNPLLIAYTLLNEGTPLVPSTQSTEVQVPTPSTEFVSALNRPEDLLNLDGDFKLNDGAVRHILKIPDDVLYTSLSVIETTTGDVDLVTPFCDSCDTPDWGTLYWTKEVCLAYDGAVLPENSGNSPSWVRVDDIPANVFATPFSGVLTYGTTGPTRTVYRNPTSLPDSLALRTEISIKMRVLQDTTLGLGDSQVRLGFSSSAGFTLSLAFVTTPLGERYVLLVDQNTFVVLGGIPFDWYDGNFHTYRMVREPTSASVLVYVDS